MERCRSLTRSAPSGRSKTPTPGVSARFALSGLIFLIMTGNVLYIIPCIIFTLNYYYITTFYSIFCTVVYYFFYIASISPQHTLQQISCRLCGGLTIQWNLILKWVESKLRNWPELNLWPLQGILSTARWWVSIFMFQVYLLNCWMENRRQKSFKPWNAWIPGDHVTWYISDK